MSDAWCGVIRPHNPHEFATGYYGDRRLLAHCTGSTGEAPSLARASVGDCVEVTLRGELIAYDDELGKWTLRGSADTGDESGHVTWEWPLHWATKFTPLRAVK